MLERKDVVRRLRTHYHESQIPRDLLCTEFEYGKQAKFEFTVDDLTSSATKNLYGGVVYSLTDGLTAMLTIDEDKLHVSSNIQVTYLRPAPTNSKVTVECSMVYFGKLVKNIEAKFINEEGKLIAIGRHNLLGVAPKIDSKL